MGREPVFHYEEVKVSRNFIYTLNLKINDAQMGQIISVSDRLGLEKREIARRAITIGLRALDRARLPGSTVVGAGRQQQLELNLKGGK